MTLKVGATVYFPNWTGKHYEIGTQKVKSLHSNTMTSEYEDETQTETMKSVELEDHSYRSETDIYTDEAQAAEHVRMLNQQYLDAIAASLAHVQEQHRELTALLNS